MADIDKVAVQGIQMANEQNMIRVAVDIALFTIRDEKFQILLIKRGIPPFLGFWALPGGLIRTDLGQSGEDPESAAIRELREETGLTVAPGYIEQLKTYGHPDRDPRNRVISIAHMGIGPTLDNPTGGSDATHAEFVPVKDVSNDYKLAFDHETIIADAIDRARNKLEYSTLATEFCSPEFTMTELRNVYETIWGKPLDPGNFQKKVLGCEGFVEGVGRTSPTSSTGGRPAKLYKAGPAEIINLPIRSS
jgi:8-oxo-dGTP diphosphatase